jgi:very-short-patch-repair endonuclease
MRGLRFHERLRSRELRQEQSPAEKLLWGKLRTHRLCGFKFVRQEPIGPYFVDFLCREHRLIVEVYGATHSTNEELAGDRFRHRRLEEEGFRVLRVTNQDVYSNLDGICETILHAIKRAPDESPLPQAGRGGGARSGRLAGDLAKVGDAEHRPA